MVLNMKKLKYPQVTRNASFFMKFNFSYVILERVVFKSSNYTVTPFIEMV